MKRLFVCRRRNSHRHRKPLGKMEHIKIPKLLCDLFDAEKTALLLGAILTISRVVRVISNWVFVRVYRKTKGHTGWILACLMLSSLLLSIFGSLLTPVWLKLTAMAIGYIIILFVRDPFTLFMQDIVLTATPKDQHGSALTMLRMGFKIAGAGLGLISSAILLKFPMIAVLGMLAVFAFAEVIIVLKLKHCAK